jgi:hypothetical protein
MGELLTLWKRAVDDKTEFIERIIGLLNDNDIRYCLIGGVALNAYVEPVFTADLDVAIAVEDLDRLRALVEPHFRVKEFEHSLNVSEPGVRLQVQFQLEPEYAEFVSRAERRDVLGLTVPVASMRDLLQGKIWAANDPSRRRSKHLKDLSDIARLVEAEPSLAAELPPNIAEQIGLSQSN